MEGALRLRRACRLQWSGGPPAVMDDRKTCRPKSDKVTHKSELTTTRSVALRLDGGPAATAHQAQLYRCTQTTQLCRCTQTTQLYRCTQTTQLYRCPQTTQLYRSTQTTQLHRSTQTTQLYRSTQTTQLYRCTQTAQLHRTPGRVQPSPASSTAHPPILIVFIIYWPGCDKRKMSHS